MKYTDMLINRFPSLTAAQKNIEECIRTIVDMHNNGGKLLLCGNGGSSADCEHISGELLKGFLSKRELKDKLPDLDKEIREKLQDGIAAIPMTSLSALITAFSNDVSPDLIYAQLVLSLGRKEDVFLGISTSGNAKNVNAALLTAKAMGIKTIALTGRDGGELAKSADISIIAPENETYKIQELHLPIYHAICADVEKILF